jgi:hypothetical protein
MNSSPNPTINCTAHMWESPPPQFHLLIEDCLRSYPDMPGEL